MDRDEFKKLLKVSGFKNKNELAKFLGLTHSAVNNWGSSAEFPFYIEILLKALAKNKELEAQNQALKTLLKSK